MQTYEMPLVPGPTSVCQDVLAAYHVDYGSADQEPEFLTLYADTQARLRQIMGTQNRVALMSGEGMVALWGALKSTVQPGDKVLAVATGVFGYGIGDMARAIGAEVETVGFDYDQAATDLDRIGEAIGRFGPKVVTLVHCETPSGIMNPAAEVGALVRQHDVPLYYVDAVASMGGAPVLADEWRIDLCLGGTQKVFSSLPDLGIVAVSERAWGVIQEVDYPGYDALVPFRTALDDAYFPYTPNWHAVASMGGAPVLADEWRIDLCLGGTQKVFSSLPDLGIVAVSERAWHVIGEVSYPGYDALAPFRTALDDAYFPYTPNWHAVAGLYCTCGRLLDGGLDTAFARHDEAAAYCRERVLEMGLSLFPRDPATSAPTVTAAKVPEAVGWAKLDAALRRRGMVVAGSYGPLEGKVFRIGHMGCQADMDLMVQGMDTLAEVVQELGV